MIIAITGTPGVGKSSVSEVLRKESYSVVDLFSLALDQGFIIKNDEKRDSKILDVEKIDDYVKQNYEKHDIVFVDSHLSHLLHCVDYVILLRCKPVILKTRLNSKKWSEKKIKENIESEILDIILCEAVEIHPEENVFEIDTTNKNIDEVGNCIKEIIDNSFKPMKKYKIGMVDWSEEILKDF